MFGTATGASKEYRRGYQAGFHDAKRRYVPFVGVKAPHRDAYVVRYDADAPTWTALIAYRDSLQASIDTADQIAERAEANRILAADEYRHGCETLWSQRQDVGLLLRLTSQVQVALNRHRIAAKRRLHETKRHERRWIDQGALLRQELHHVNAVIRDMTRTIAQANL